MAKSPTAIGVRLKTKRIEDGLSLRDLATIVGVSFSSLARIERGVGGCTADTIRRVCLWIEAGSGSPTKERRGRPWVLTVEERLIRIEQALGLEAPS